MGADAIADRKLEAGMPLVILGIRVSLSGDGITMTPDPTKIAKWSAVIDDALQRGWRDCPCNAFIL